MPLSEDERKALANDIVAGVFLHVGIDVRDPDALARLRLDLAFLSQMSQIAQMVRSTTIRVLVTAFFSSIFALLGLGLRAWFFQH